MKKTLILETYPFQPHLEIAGEIALNLKEKNKEDVYFVWMGENLKWAEWHLSKLKNIFFSYTHRVKKILNILESRNIKIINSDNFIILDERINKWARSFKGDIYNLKNFKFGSANLGLGVASSVISHVQESNPNLDEYRDMVINSLITSAKIFLLTQKIIKKFKPEKIITFNGRFATSNAISLAAKKLKIKVLYHERGSNFKKYDIFNERLHSPQFRKKLISNYWRKKIKNKHQIAKSFFEQNLSGKRTNTLGLKFKQSLTNPKIKKETNQKIYTYFASTSYEWDAILGYKKGNWKNEFEAIKNLIFTIKKYRKDIKLIIKLHPYNKTLRNYNDLNKIKDLAKKNNIFIFDEFSKINSYKLVKKSDVIISYGSTIGAEAVYLGKPSIIMRDCFYGKTDSVYFGLNHKQLKKVISKKKLQKKKENSVLPFAFYLLNYGRNFKYYKPENYYFGKFCGFNLTYMRPFFYKLMSYVKCFLKIKKI